MENRIESAAQAAVNHLVASRLIPSEVDGKLMAAAPDLYDKSKFPRNIVIHNNPEFEGDWIAVPREDFMALREARNAVRDLGPVRR